MLFVFIFVLLTVTAQEQKMKVIQQEHDYNNTVNFTSCEQFLNNTVFDPSSVVDVDWKIFYYWNFEYEFSYNIKFSLVTPTLVDRFRIELDDEIKPAMNWTNAQLFMETNIDFSGLFIKTNVSGLYLFIPSLAIQFVNVRPKTFALKVVEPGYLGIENCGLKVCYALAPADKVPQPDQLDEEAKKLGFDGYKARAREAPQPLPPSKYEHDEILMDDDNEDEYFQIERMSEFL